MSAAYVVPEPIRKKNVYPSYIPYGRLLCKHSGLPTNTLEDGTIDMDSGKIVTSSKPLPN